MVAYLAEFYAALKSQMTAKFSSLSGKPLAKVMKLMKFSARVFRPESLQIVCN